MKAGPIPLRSYQHLAQEAIFDCWRSDINSTLAVLPTGAGKTLMAADFARRIAVPGLQTLWVVDRGELIDQARETLHKMNLSTQTEMAEQRIDADLLPRTNVILATRQTLNTEENGRKRMSKIDVHRLNLLIIDEAHHATCDGYSNLVHYVRQNPYPMVLGLTATPDRSDMESLGKVFQTCCFQYEIQDAIADGYLVKIQQLMVHIDGLDFSHIKAGANGDLSAAQLNEIVEQEKHLQGVVGATLKLIGDTKRTLVFASSVKQAERLSEIFNRHRQGSADWVEGKTPEEKRALILEAFRSGTLQILVNVNVCAEGFDVPQVEVVVQARPTLSRALYAQQLGRGMRPLPGIINGLATATERLAAIAASAKPTCTVIDFCGNSGKHKLISSVDVLAGKHTPEALDKALERIKALGSLGHPVEVGQIIAQEDEAAQKRLESARQEMHERELREAANRSRILAKVRHSVARVDPFNALGINRARPKGFNMHRLISEGVFKTLTGQGIDPTTLSYEEAMQLSRQIWARRKQALCSLRQMAVLHRHYPDMDCRAMTHSQAHDIIGRIEKNDWKTIEGLQYAKIKESHPIQHPGTNPDVAGPNQGSRSKSGGGSRRPGTTSRPIDPQLSLGSL